MNRNIVRISGQSVRFVILFCPFLKKVGTPSVAGRVLFHGIHHVSLLCVDLERSLDFYCDLLGKFFTSRQLPTMQPLERVKIICNLAEDAHDLRPSMSPGPLALAALPKALGSLNPVSHQSTLFCCVRRLEGWDPFRPHDKLHRSYNFLRNPAGGLLLPPPPLNDLSSPPPPAGLEVDPSRPHDKLPYRGAWLWIGSEMIHLMELPQPDLPMPGIPEGGENVVGVGRDRNRHFRLGVEHLAPLEARLRCVRRPSFCLISWLFICPSLLMCGSSQSVCPYFCPTICLVVPPCCPGVANSLSICPSLLPWGS